MFEDKKKFTDLAQKLFRGISPADSALDLVQVIDIFAATLTAGAKKHQNYKQKLESAIAIIRMRDTTILEFHEEKTKLMETYEEEAARPLLKQISARARKMARKEAEMKHLQLESDLFTMKEELSKALKMPDKVREECFSKSQRGHDRVSKLEKKLKTEEDARNITKLDSAATAAKIPRPKARHELFMTKTTEVIKERDELRKSEMICELYMSPRLN
ncbi:hypothetical protein DSL72_001181 [Monilinia vaccinii-corymbosi]|uniref:Uncharacterized protein n=1 Tax=Monilinia vaccinii-corymbosi TaxID=61207 RepID=A0A8A3P5K6_9HELO|nr:hypothetical protein DSL72_001181 [Monilinia vaccinii-corymbosi]